MLYSTFARSLAGPTQPSVVQTTLTLRSPNVRMTLLVLLSSSSFASQISTNHLTVFRSRPRESPSQHRCGCCWYRPYSIDPVISPTPYNGWHMYCAWKTTGYQSKPYDGKCTHAPEEEPEGRDWTGLTPYLEIWSRLAWHGKMQNKQQSTEKTGADVWPNVSSTRALNKGKASF